jgi:hypothetical protein
VPLTGSHHDTYAALGRLQHTALRTSLSVWPSPGKEPHQDVDGAIVVSIHAESTFRALIRPLAQWHGVQIPTATTLLGCVALI